MPLGLVPGVRTQDQGWPFQEVHHCDTHVMVAYREKNVHIYMDLTTKLLRIELGRAQFFSSSHTWYPGRDDFIR